MTMTKTNTTKRLYIFATVGFMVGGVAWGASGLISGEFMHGVLGASNLCLGVMFLLLSRSATEGEPEGPPRDSA